MIYLDHPIFAAINSSNAIASSPEGPFISNDKESLEGELESWKYDGCTVEEIVITRKKDASHSIAID